jgi:hypothetical protein
LFTTRAFSTSLPRRCSISRSRTFSRALKAPPEQSGPQAIFALSAFAAALRQWWLLLGEKGLYAAARQDPGPINIDVRILKEMRRGEKVTRYGSNRLADREVVADARDRHQGW